ncbi:GAF domain-containing protein [Nocardia iowensis]|uniref:GAF domain-containing protein n=1 Tax=Nocardia iowensis TaxID=204891 RepID=A0ABX8RV39_NOCIO|nr:GAF domain-containing protein [Nocardia iowensis]QXN93509.1 GAF domain-containing protein [Nocardia iowensis]
MRSYSDAHQEIAREWQEFSAERGRAARAATVAAKYEAQAVQRPESMQPFRRHMAELHRRIEARHLACARLHRLHALRLQRWYIGDRASLRPVFMAAVAQHLRMDSAAVTLFGRAGEELLVAASDGTARTAHDLELLIGEGPAREVLDGRDFVAADSTDLAARWPQYGPALTEIGVRSVVAVPLRSSRLLGALCVFTSRAGLRNEVAPAATKVADALANTVLLAAHGTDDGSGPMGTLFDDADYLTAVHQAVGMVAVQCSCDLDAALALLRARAFAEGIAVSEIAHWVLEDGYQLCCPSR